MVESSILLQFSPSSRLYCQLPSFKGSESVPEMITPLNALPLPSGRDGPKRLSTVSPSGVVVSSVIAVSFILSSETEIEIICFVIPPRSSVTVTLKLSSP